jgi:uncharacterized protein (DUF2141 family)
MKINRFSMVFAVGLTVATWVAGCDSSSSDSTDVSKDVLGDAPADLPGDPGVDPGGDIPTPAKARLRAIHLSPDAPAVDIFANGGATAAVTNLVFPAGTGYLELDAGTYTFDVAPKDAGVGASVLQVKDLPLESGKSYTAVAYDAVASIKALALVDDYAGLEAGKIRVRAIHAAAGVGQVDIWNIPAMGDPAALYTDVDFGAVGAYLDLPAGAYTLGIDVDNDGTPDLTFTTPALAAGTVANVFAVKQASAVFLLAQFADGTTARIDPTM